MIWRIVILVAGGAAAWAQLPPPQAAPPRLDRPTESPVRIDAVAYDRQGQPVAGLTPADFALAVNGTAHKIEACEYRTGQPLRLAVILDDLSLNAERNNAARRELRLLVERLKPGDEMAVLRTSGGAGALDHYTSDPRELQSAIDGAAYNPAADGAPPETLTGAFRVTLRGMLEGMRDLPGRKALLFLSERLREPARGAHIATVGLAAIANAASASVYIVDMTGAPERTSLDLGLRQLAEDTGGMYFNGGSVADSLAQIGRDQAAYYLLTFRPQGLAYDFFAASARIESLRLTSARVPALRSRNGIFGSNGDDESGIGELELNPNRALGRELVADRLRARVTAVVALERSWRINGLLFVDGNDVTFTRAADGKCHGSFDIIASLTANDGSVRDERVANTVDLTLSENGLEDVRKWGLTYTVTIPVSKPGSFQFLLVVRDEPSGRIGTARASVTADWGANQLSMSSLIVHGDLVKEQSGDKPQDPAESTPIRSFRGGRKVHYGYELVNVASDAEKRSLVEVRARVWRDGALVLETEPMPVRFDPSDDPARRGASGTLALTQQSKAGRYVLGVTVMDKLSGRSATRFMDFDVRP